MKWILSLGALLIVGTFVLSPRVGYAQDASVTVYSEAVVQSISPDGANQIISVQITSGTDKGKAYKITSTQDGQSQRQDIRKGDEVFIAFMTTPNGEKTPYIVDHIRKNQLGVLLFVFLAFVVIIGRWKGLLSFIGMIFSFIIISQFIVPQIDLGNNPLIISLLGSIFIIPVTFYTAHGINKKTTVAVISTFIALALTGILAYIFVQFTRLTGFAAEEAIFIQSMTGGSIDIKNLLLAGIVIGAMGVLDDITISQAAIVDKLAKANPRYTFNQLFSTGMEVGRDHIASLVNTLILVYTGAALPLFLLFSKSQLSYSQAVNQEIIATEVVRTLVSSIGIIAAVPITTFLAAYIVRKK